MWPRSDLRILPALLTAALGCTTLAAQPSSCPPSIEQAFAKPTLLREQADAALEDGDLALAYRYLALIETLHPGSPESHELFPAAAKLFKRIYLRERIARPDSIWMTSEPIFMFHWLVAFFSDDGEFPKQQVATLFIGMPLTFFDDFMVFAKPRPQLARWQIRAKEDDGRIESISGQLAQGSHGSVSALGR
jgi:hypothetical protein